LCLAGEDAFSGAGLVGGEQRGPQARRFAVATGLRAPSWVAERDPGRSRPRLVADVDLAERSASAAAGTGGELV